MRHADLDQGPAGGPQLDQQLGGEERPAGLDGDPGQRLTPEQLAGAIDVADPQPEPDEVRDAIGAGIERPNERVRPLDPEKPERRAAP